VTKIFELFWCFYEQIFVKKSQNWHQKIRFLLNRAALLHRFFDSSALLRFKIRLILKSSIPKADILSLAWKKRRDWVDKFELLFSPFGSTLCAQFWFEEDCADLVQQVVAKLSTYRFEPGRF